MTTCLRVDDEELRELTGQRLAGCGMRIRMARTVQSCRESLANGGIEIVLLDRQLPDGEGIEVCREIRVNMNVPVIMLTASVGPVSNQQIRRGQRPLAD